MREDHFVRSWAELYAAERRFANGAPVDGDSGPGHRVDAERP